jgi:hypothetical protein
VLQTAHLNRLLRQAAGTEHRRTDQHVHAAVDDAGLLQPENFGHFGLALQQYAHFTSPIRRYADLIVHRALISAHGWGNDGLSPRRSSGWKRPPAYLGHRAPVDGRRARHHRPLPRRLSCRDRVGNEFTGRISGIARFGAFVKLDETGADGLMPMRSLGREYFHVTAETETGTEALDVAAMAAAALDEVRVPRWITGFEARALAAGISQATLRPRLCRGRLQDAAWSSATATRPSSAARLWDYLDSAVSDTASQRDAPRWPSIARTLERIERRYGVEAEVVARSGASKAPMARVRGSTDIISAMATLAYDGRRRDFFEAQLIAALQILQSGDVAPGR